MIPKTDLEVATEGDTKKAAKTRKCFAAFYVEWLSIRLERRTVQQSVKNLFQNIFFVQRPIRAILHFKDNRGLQDFQ